MNSVFSIERLKEVMDRLTVLVPIAAIAVVAYFGLDMYKFLTDSGSPLALKVNELKAIKEEVIVVEKKVQELKKFRQEIEIRRSEIAELSKKLNDIKGTLNDNFDVPVFMQKTVSDAKMVGLNVLGLKPSGKDNKDLYAEQSFEFAFRGVYPQLIVFLRWLTQRQEITRVDNFNIHSTKNVLAGYTQIEGIVQIRGYYYLRSKADDLPSADAAPAKPSTPATPAQAPGGGKAAPRMQQTGET